jgi:hypothetical protein
MLRMRVMLEQMLWSLGHSSSLCSPGVTQSQTRLNVYKPSVIDIIRKVIYLLPWSD